MKYQSILITISILFNLTACANTPADKNEYVPTSRPYLPVEVNVISDTKGMLPEYPVNSDSSHYRAYLQAANNDRYRIRLVNNSGNRIGIVVAVDGRNIISGQKSYLQNNERMYILDPGAIGEYEGWRTDTNRVNRFYFTQQENSYAAAWDDNSAMGVIALAVYPEQPQPVRQEYEQMAIPGRSAPAAAESKARENSPGTGFGESHYSPSMSITFLPQAQSIEKVFLKYEWPEVLCRKKILAACPYPTQPNSNTNRFWPEDYRGFAPPPR